MHELLVEAASGDDRTLRRGHVVGPSCTHLRDLGGAQAALRHRAVILLGRAVRGPVVVDEEALRPFPQSRHIRETKTRALAPGGWARTST